MLQSKKEALLMMHKLIHDCFVPPICFRPPPRSTSRIKPNTPGLQKCSEMQNSGLQLFLSHILGFLVNRFIGLLDLVFDRLL